MAKQKAIKRKVPGKGRAGVSAPRKKSIDGRHQEIGLLVGLATKMRLLIGTSVDTDDLQDWLRTGLIQLDWKRNSLTGPDGEQIGTFEIARATIREVSADLSFLRRHDTSRRPHWFRLEALCHR
jgi:hypothetical protein